MLWNLRIHLCIWVRQLPTTVTLNPKSSADAHYRQMWCRHSASHCGASSPFRVPPRCTYTMLKSCLCCCTARRPGLIGTLFSRLDSRALRSILGIHWRDLVSNETVRPLTGQPPASSLAARRRVRWYWRASLATTPSFSGYPGLRPWLVRLEATPRSPTHTLDWRGQILTSWASIQPQLNPSRRTVMNGGLSWIWLAPRTTCRGAPRTRHDDGQASLIIAARKGIRLRYKPSIKDEVTDKASILAHDYHIHAIRRNEINMFWCVWLINPSDERYNPSLSDKKMLSITSILEQRLAYDNGT